MCQLRPIVIVIQLELTFNTTQQVRFHHAGKLGRCCICPKMKPVVYLLAGREDARMHIRRAIRPHVDHQGLGARAVVQT